MRFAAAAAAAAWRLVCNEHTSRRRIHQLAHPAVGLLLGRHRSMGGGGFCMGRRPRHPAWPRPARLLCAYLTVSVEGVCLASPECASMSAGTGVPFFECVVFGMLGARFKRFMPAFLRSSFSRRKDASGWSCHFSSLGCERPPQEVLTRQCCVACGKSPVYCIATSQALPSLRCFPFFVWVVSPHLRCVNS